MFDWLNAPQDCPSTALHFTKNTHLDVYPEVDPTVPANNLSGKVVVIAGTSRGIESDGMVPPFAKAGVRAIALLATDAEKLASTERKIKKINPAVDTLICPLEITWVKDAEDTFADIKAQFGHADFLWHNFQVNSKFTYLLIHAFLCQPPYPDMPTVIVNVSSWQTFFIVPQMNGYFMSKFSLDHLSTCVAAEYPSVIATSLYPGFVPTDMFREPFRTLFDHASAELIGGTAVWLFHEKTKFLSGRWIATNWDVEDLFARREEILSSEQWALGRIGVTCLASLLPTRCFGQG
ncbi:hypothetical protein PSPO01_01530 [Paraphaeosphaeria sporulosa]